MTRLLVLADIHADVHALRDALRQCERLGCDKIVCVGDVVGYGLFPQETIDLVRERGIICIRGNHDRWAVGRGRADDPEGNAAGKPFDASGWDLSRDAIRFLANLPSVWDAVIDGVRVAARHGTPRSDMEGIDANLATASDVRKWLDEAKAEVLVVGHTHVPFALTTFGGGLIVNPGALLRDPAGRQEAGLTTDGGTFGILELPTKRFGLHRASDGTEIPCPAKAVGVTDRRGRG